jgi:hypothetical protein
MGFREQWIGYVELSINVPLRPKPQEREVTVKQIFDTVYDDF